jgi:membrane-associated PAP2 superfamily phosphatase
MTTPESKRKMIEEQVIAKVRWGEEDEGVLQWLADKHAIMGAEAQQFLVRAKTLRAQAIRERAVKAVTISAIVLVIAISYIAVSPWSWNFDVRACLLVVAFLALAIALIVLIKNVLRISSGNMTGPVDR